MNVTTNRKICAVGLGVLKGIFVPHNVTVKLMQRRQLDLQWLNQISVQ